jgi:hypothetical protein
MPKPCGRKDRSYVRRYLLPYGEWICPDGRRVYFDRDYRPLLEKVPGEAPRRADPQEWVLWIAQRFFYNDGTHEHWKVQNGKDALARWGLRVAEARSR